MKVVGIVAEFNPFHAGHKYIIEKAKEETGADTVVIVMSGDFVQRGKPAVYDKYRRTEAALEGGADFIFELPIEFSCASAGFFAEGAVAFFSKLGIEDIVFGSEIDDINVLTKIAKVLEEEPVKYKEKLQHFLQEGLSYPSARSKAFLEYIKEANLSEYNDKKSVYEEIFSTDSPNAMLGVSYIQSSIKLGANIRFHAVKRIGPDYNDGKEDIYIPDGSSYRAIIRGTNYNCLDIDDFTLMFKTKLIYETKESLQEYLDVDETLANRIEKNKYNFSSIFEFIYNVKSKNITYTRVTRVITHILLNIKKDTLKNLIDDGYILYYRLLGMNTSKSSFLSSLEKNSNVPIVTTKKTAMVLEGNSLEAFNRNICASVLYETIFSTKYKREFTHEYEKEIVKVKR